MLGEGAGGFEGTGGGGGLVRREGCGCRDFGGVGGLAGEEGLVWVWRLMGEFEEVGWWWWRKRVYNKPEERSSCYLRVGEDSQPIYVCLWMWLVVVLRASRCCMAACFSDLWGDTGEKFEGGKKFDLGKV